MVKIMKIASGSAVLHNDAESLVATFFFIFLCNMRYMDVDSMLYRPSLGGGV